MKDDDRYSFAIRVQLIAIALVLAILALMYFQNAPFKFYSVQKGTEYQINGGCDRPCDDGHISFVNLEWGEESISRDFEIPSDRYGHFTQVWRLRWAGNPTPSFNNRHLRILINRAPYQVQTGQSALMLDYVIAIEEDGVMYVNYTPFPDMMVRAWFWWAPEEVLQ